MALVPKIILAGIILGFVAVGAPKIGLRPAAENTMERQAQTMGMVRLYCQNPSRHPLKSPQLPFGLDSFNQEFSLVEWAEGHVARVVDGGSCESVERVSQIVALASAVAALIVAFLLAQFMAGTPAGVLAAFLLATDEYWLKFATYMITDVRVISCAFFAMWLGIKQRRLWAMALWGLVGATRPQAFIPLSVFYLGMLTVKELLAKESLNGNLKAERSIWLKQMFRLSWPVAGGGAIALVYLGASASFNRAHDLPWFAWAGPRIFGTYFGEWGARWSSSYWKSLMLDSVHKTQLPIALTGLVGLWMVLWTKGTSHAFSPMLRRVLLLWLPFLLARFLYTFLFLRVFQWHDYYAIPLNALGALAGGILIGSTLSAILDELRNLPSKSAKAAWLWAVCAVMAIPVIGGSAAIIRADSRFTAGRSDPGSGHYCAECRKKIFPDDAKMVVVVNPGNVTDLRYLYFAGKPGHTWCFSNPEFAPRKFWKEQGVTHVGWPYPDPERKGAWLWKVVTLGEELTAARAHGWSSDINDAWEGHTMAEWAAIASSRHWEICRDVALYDPRKWH